MYSPGWSSDNTGRQRWKHWRHEAQSHPRFCGTLPDNPNQSRPCTHLSYEYLATPQETRAFALVHASSEHLPLRDLVPEAPHSWCPGSVWGSPSRLPTAPALAQQGFLVWGSPSTKVATLLLEPSRPWKRYSPVLLKSPPSYKSFAWCFLLCLFVIEL